MQMRKGTAFLRKQKGAYTEHMRTSRSEVRGTRRIREANSHAKHEVLRIYAFLIGAND